MTRRSTVPCLALLVTARAAAVAQPHAHQQSASERLGTVHFATSCSPSVSADFNRAVALLHSFEFGGSIDAFHAVVAKDSTCAMAYWGLALSRWTNPMSQATRPASQLAAGRASIDSGRQVVNHATPRERLYVEAVGQLYRDYEHVDQRTRIVAYKKAMEDLVARAPADTEAKIFYALALAAAAPPGDKTYANQLAAGAILEPLWARQPDHPGLAHYLIHAYDVPALASRAAAAADRYATIAPSAAHALHMPSHIFTRIGDWPSSIATNRRSIPVAIGAGAFAEALHASDYMEYAYLQLGQDSAARRVRDTVSSLVPRLQPGAIVGAASPDAGAFAAAAIPARYALERNDWPAAAALIPRATPFPWTDAMTYFARSLGESRLGDTTAARRDIDSLQAIADLLQGREPYWADQVAIEQLGAEGWLAFARGQPDTALTRLAAAARREDATEKSALTPGPLAPAREMRADLLRELGRPREALEEYRATLRKEPHRFRSVYGALRAAERAGDRPAVAHYRSELRQLCRHADRPLCHDFADADAPEKKRTRDQ